MMKKHMATVTATPDANPNEPEMIVTTKDRDRDDDRLMPEGADLTAFRKNPALLWGHDYSELPIGTVERISAEADQGLRARWRWLEGDARAERVKNAWRQGVVRAASVGFIPRREEPNEFGGRDVIAWELLEISLVAIPANPFATRVLKNLGLLADPREDLFLEVDHSAPLGKERKMLFDVDLSQVRTLVEKAILGTIPAPEKEHHDSPAWKAFRHKRKIIEDNDRRWERAKAEGYLRLKEQAEHDLQRSNDFSLCPLLPPPQVRV